MIRVAIFIDGPSLHRACAQLQFEVDFARLQANLVDPDDFILCATYFALVADDGEYEGIRKLLDWLEDHGYRVRTRQGAVMVGEDERRRVRGALAVEIAVEALALANSYDTAIIVSSDAELVPLVDRLQTVGKRVVVVAPKVGSAELRRQADHFRDLDALKPHIMRPARPAREAVQA